MYISRFSKAEWARKRAGDFLSAFLAGPQPSDDVLISCLVDAVGEQDAALLDTLERKILAERKELGRGERG